MDDERSAPCSEAYEATRARASTNGQQREPRTRLFNNPAAWRLRHPPCALCTSAQICPIIRLTLHALYGVAANSHRFCTMALRRAATSAHPHCVMPHLFSAAARFCNAVPRTPSNAPLPNTTMSIPTNTSLRLAARLQRHNAIAQLRIAASQHCGASFLRRVAQ